MKKTNNNLREETVKALKYKKIKSEITRLKKVIKNDTGKEIIKVVEGLIEEAAFIKVTLEETRINILDQGTTYKLEQGKQKIKIVNPNLKIYTSLINRYVIVMKQLITLLNVNKEEEESLLMEFINRND